MGHLGQNAHTVTGLALRVLAGPVLQILHNLQRIFHGGAALFPLDIHTGADTAGIMLKFRPVQRGCGNIRLYIKHSSFLLSMLLSLFYP